jgi:hypothetical protein
MDQAAAMVMCFSDRLYLALTGETGTEWLPAWDRCPIPSNADLLTLRSQ